MDNAYQTLLGQFLSTPSARRATRAGGVLLLDLKFLSTPSARRATRSRTPRSTPTAYFYPRPPRGGRQHLRRCAQDALKISIHALREEGDLAGEVLDEATYRFLSTPSARRATPDTATKVVLYEISIHALREEGDPRSSPRCGGCPISIHALREEGDAPA